MSNLRLIKLTTLTKLTSLIKRLTIPSLSLAALAIVVVAIFSVYLTSPKPAHAAPSTPPDSCFDFNFGTGTITDYYDYESNNNSNPACTREVIIPDTLGGDLVTAIGNHAFDDNQLTSVTIPNSVTSIGDSAFEENQLTSVTMGSSVTIIGNYAFGWNQLTSVTIPNSVTSIGDSAFEENQLTSVTIEGNITTAGSNVFRYNPIQTFTYGLDTYSPSDLTPIIDNCYTFDGVNAITSFNKADIATIRDHSNACLNPNVNIPSSIGGNAITTIGNSALSSSGLTSLTIGNSVTSINDSAFANNQLTSVTIPNSVTSIGDAAFSYSQIADVAIPDSVTSLSPYAFMIQTKPGGTSYIDFWNSDQSPQNGQYFLDSVIYTNIYASSSQVTALSLSDSAMTELDDSYDYNADGDQTDIVSGHLINPARVTATYKDTEGNTIAPSTTATGTGLSTYLAVDNPTNDLGLYYRVGNSYTVPTAPSIAGYTITTTPSNIASLSAGDNQINYVYTANSNGDDNGNDGGNNPNTSQLTTPTSPIANFSLKPVSLTTPTGTTINSSSTVPESSLVAQDNNNQYPLGLVNFSFTTNQSSNQVVLNFETNLKPNQVTPRKYNSNTNTYNNLPTSANPTITETTIDGKHHLTLTYTIIDNGELDLDPTTGIIKDPVGLAVTNSTYDQLASTGENTYFFQLLAGILVALGIGIVGVWYFRWGRKKGLG
ncbi:leucine-rich repeat protein [bacterium]|nr:MAG: leucine-rich repeat protein [bacterium]